MSRRTPSFDEAVVAAAITRALHAVADATPIAPPPLLSQVIPLRPLDGRARRPDPHTRGWLVAAAAVVVLAIGVPIAVQASRGDDAPDTSTSIAAPPPLVPTSLPHGFPPGEQFQEVELAGLHIEGAIMLPDGSLSRPGRDTPAILVATAEDPAGNLTGDQLDLLARRLTAVFGAGGDHNSVTYVTDVEVGGRRGYVALARGDASSGDADAVLRHLREGAKLVDAVPVPLDWNAFPLPLGWVPGLSATSGVRYADGGRTVSVTTAEAELPWLYTLAPLMGDFRPLPLATGAGWRWMPWGPGSALVVWRAAPGLVGTVVARGLSSFELARLIDSIPTPQPFPATLGPGEIRTVARSNPGTSPVYAIELARGVPFTLPDGEERVDCLDFVVENNRAGYLCDIAVNPDVPTAFLGPVARTDEDVTVLGIFDPSVARVISDGPPGLAFAQPLVPGDPGSLRYALITLPQRPDHEALLRLFDSDDVELRTEMVDLDREFPPQG
jgi:hypothetical protein